MRFGAYRLPCSRVGVALIGSVGRCDRSIGEPGVCKNMPSQQPAIVQAHHFVPQQYMSAPRALRQAGYHALQMTPRVQPQARPEMQADNCGVGAQGGKR